jgi:murein DD-endopeptidase MepM/ murein hydrolase activator NlpD
VRVTHTRVRRLSAVAAAVAAAFALVFGILAPSVQAEDRTKALKDKIKSAQTEYAAAAASAAKASAALANVKSKLPTAQARLAEANRRFAAALAADRAASKALAAAIAEDRRLQSELVEMQSRIEDMSTKVFKLARRLYTQGGTFIEMEIVLESKDPSEFTERLAAVNSVARSSNKMLAEMDTMRADLAVAQAKAEARREAIDQKRDEARRLFAAANEAKAEAQVAKKEVDALISQRQVALKSAETEKSKALRELNALKAEQAALLAKARKNANAFAGPGPSGLYWPVTGASTSGQVGWRRHPVYGYRSCHTGIDLRAGHGTPIRSAANGVVVDVSTGGAYGKRTLLAHGGGMTSMYAHQSRIVVSQGQKVSAGQVIGYVGSTGFSTGPHLHWEVHINGVPRNPLGWFGGAKSIIACYSQV